MVSDIFWQREAFSSVTALNVKKRVELLQNKLDIFFLVWVGFQKKNVKYICVIKKKKSEKSENLTKDLHQHTTKPFLSNLLS